MAELKTKPRAASVDRFLNLTAFAPRKQSITLYLMGGFDPTTT